MSKGNEAAERYLLGQLLAQYVNAPANILRSEFIGSHPLIITRRLCDLRTGGAFSRHGFEAPKSPTLVIMTSMASKMIVFVEKQPTDIVRYATSDFAESR